MSDFEDEINYQYLIPDNWKWTTVENVAQKEKGSIRMGPFGSQLKKAELTDKGIRVLWIENVVKNEFEYKQGKFITEKKYEQLKGFTVTPDELLITMMGTIGRVAIVPDDIGRAIISSHLLRIRLDNQLCEPKYMKYFILSNNAKRQMDKKSRGVVMKGLNTKIIKSIVFPLPPFAEQGRIVNKLEELFTKLDAGVTSFQNVKAQLQLYRQAVLKHAFIGKLTEDWRKTHKDTIEPEAILLANILKEQKIKGKERDSEPPKIEISVLPELPEAWTLIRVKDITESMKNGIYKPKQYYADKGIACLRMYNIQKGSINWVNIKRMTLTPVEIEDYGLKQGDILLNRVNSRELVGKAAVISSELEPCVFESKNIRLRIVRKLMNNKFLNYWLLYFGQRYFNSNAQQTVGMASVNQTQLGSMPIPFTSLIEQNLIVERIEAIFSICDTTENIVEKRIMQSELLRQSILKRAFSGKLVAQDPADEPAEKLLETIRKEKEKTSNLKGSSRRKTSKRNQRRLKGYVE